MKWAAPKRLQLTHQTIEPVKPGIMTYNSNAKSNAALALLVT